MKLFPLHPLPFLISSSLISTDIEQRIGQKFWIVRCWERVKIEFTCHCVYLGQFFPGDGSYLFIFFFLYLLQRSQSSHCNVQFPFCYGNCHEEGWKLRALAIVDFLYSLHFFFQGSFFFSFSSISISLLLITQLILSSHLLFFDFLFFFCFHLFYDSFCFSFYFSFV